jgi:hypothetical protein
MDADIGVIVASRGWGMNISIRTRSGSSSTVPDGPECSDRLRLSAASKNYLLFLWLSLRLQGLLSLRMIRLLGGCTCNHTLPLYLCRTVSELLLPSMPAQEAQNTRWVQRGGRNHMRNFLLASFKEKEGTSVTKIVHGPITQSLYMALRAFRQYVPIITADVSGAYKERQVWGASSSAMI